MTLSSPAVENESGLARIGADLRLKDYSASFARLVGGAAPGRFLSDVLPVFAGVEDFLRRMPERGPRLWQLYAVHHTLPGESASRYLDVMIAVDKQGDGWTVSVRDVTPEIERQHRDLQRRNEARLRQQYTPITDHLLQKLSPDILAALWDHLGLMLALLDANLTVEAVTPSLAQSLQQSLIGRSLAAILPELAGLEDELGRIARGEAEPWRLPGLHLAALAPSLWDVLFVPRADAPGLLFLLRGAQTEASVEQELRQQRNELSLLHDKLEAQALALRTANERLVNLDRERRALMELIVGDIKSALTVIGGYGQWLAQQLTTTAPMQHEAITAIQEAVTRIDRLLDRVTAVERLENQLDRLQRVPLDLRPLLEEAVAMRHAVARLHHLNLLAELPEQPLPVVGDADLLAEACGRLLDYAIACAVASARIAVTARLWKEWVLVEIGIGIPGRPRQSAVKVSPSSSPHVFELTQARLVVESHDGHLTLEETKGSLHLIVWLPLLAEATEQPKVMVTPHTAAPDEYEPLVVAGGALRIDRTRQQAWLHGQPLALTPLEYRLLVYLAQHRKRVIGYEELLTAISQEKETMSLNHLRVLIARLRSKLGDSEETGGILRTVRGVGYTLAS